MKKKRIMRKKGLAIGLVDVYAFTWFIVTVMVFFMIFGVMKSCSSEVCFAKEMVAGLVTGESKDCDLNIVGVDMTVAPLRDYYNMNSLMRMPLKVDGHDMTMAELAILIISQADDERQRSYPDLKNKEYYKIIWDSTLKAIKELYDFDEDCYEISIIHRSAYMVPGSARKIRTMGRCLSTITRRERKWYAHLPYPPLDKADVIDVEIRFAFK